MGLFDEARIVTRQPYRELFGEIPNQEMGRLRKKLHDAYRDAALTHGAGGLVTDLNDLVQDADDEYFARLWATLGW